MSNITEAAKRATLEPDEDPDEGRELEAKDEADAERKAKRAQASGEPTKAQLKRLEAENERHVDEVRAIMGEFVEGFIPCPECGTVGLTTPPDPQPELLSNEQFKRCDTCNGWGQVKTGALTEAHALQPCPGCGGTGFLVKVPAEMQGGQPQPAPAAAEYGRPTWLGDPSIAPSVGPAYVPPPQ